VVSLDTVRIGASNNKSDDQIKFTLNTTELPPLLEINWLLILAALLAGAGATYAGTA